MEIIKTYGNLTALGSTTVLLTGWSTETELYFQWFLHIESNDPEVHLSEIHKTPSDPWGRLYRHSFKSSGEEELLESFMNFGLQRAQGALQEQVFKKMERLNVSRWPDITLKEGENYIGTVMYLKRKFPEYFNLMKGQVQQNELKAFIQIAEGIEITEMK